MSIDRLIKKAFEPYAKSRKAKSTVGCVYKKEGDYYWVILMKPHSKYQCTIITGIKPWRYDELLNSIIDPDEKMHFTDLMRWNSYVAMDMYYINKRYYEYPDGSDEDNIPIESLEQWCGMIFSQEIEEIDKFVSEIEAKYDNMSEFYIANASIDILSAAFAYIDEQKYENAMRLLIKAREEGREYQRYYGSIDRDLREILYDYCKVKLEGGKWDKQSVLGIKKTLIR